MKSRRSVLVVLLLFPILFIAPMEGFHHPNDGFLHGHGEAAAEEKTLYTCSMHPFIIQEGPGTCPICGMDLVPAHKHAAGEGDEAAGAMITIDPSMVQNMGVRTAAVTRRDLGRTVRTVGIVGYDESRQYSVNAKIDGWIEKLHVNQTGERVLKGRPLLDIYSPDLVSAQEEFLLAVRNNAALSRSPFPEIASGARNLLGAARKRLSYWDITDRQIDALEKTGEIRKTLTLHAPHAGVVTKKGVNEGAFVKAGMELFQLSDISHVWVYADIYEYELPWVRTGQKATIHFPYPRDPLVGTVSTVYPYVESKTRTVKARIDVDNKDLDLKPDMYVNVVVEGNVIHDSLAIPSEAVLRSGQQETVFVALGGGRFEPRKVKTGLRSDDGSLQILSGLHENEQIVISAQFMLDSESKLREAVQKLLSPQAAPADTSKPAQKKEDLEALFD